MDFAYFEYIQKTFIEGLEGPFQLIVSPERRLYYISIFSSLIAAWIVLSFKTKKFDLKRFVSIIFSKKLWLHPSSLLDIRMLFANSLFKVFLITPWLIGSFTLTVTVIKIMRGMFGEIQPIQIDYFFMAILYTIVQFVLSDFLRFFQHYLFHKIPFLWEFHKVHHSAEVLTPLTLHRNHPIEMIVSSIRNVFVSSFPAAVFIYLFKNNISGIDILGVNIFGFAFNFAASNLRHSQIWLSFGPFEKFFISPAQHQIHHANDRELCHTNFGICLSIWDRLFNTIRYAKNNRDFDFGLPLKIRNHSYSVISVYLSPIKSAFTRKQ